MTLQVIIIWWMRDERLGCVITSFTQCLLSWRQCWWCSTCLHPHRLSTVFQLSFRSCMNLGNTWKWSDRKLHYWHIRLEARLEMLFTWWTWNCWTTLVIFLFHNTILPNWFDERTNPEKKYLYSKCYFKCNLYPYLRKHINIWLWQVQLRQGSFVIICSPSL